MNNDFHSLYKDLFSNSPQTVTIDIPKDMGIGRISQVVTKQGTVLSDWHMNYYSDTNVQGINSEEYIQMLFCLNEGCSWSIANEQKKYKSPERRDLYLPRSWKDRIPLLFRKEGFCI